LDPRTNTRRELLSSAQRAQLLGLPTSLRELEERYSFTPSDLELIGAHRTTSNRLGIAVLCFLRRPGRTWRPEGRIPATMLHWIAAKSERRASKATQARPDPREHFLELLVPDRANPGVRAEPPTPCRYLCIVGAAITTSTSVRLRLDGSTVQWSNGNSLGCTGGPLELCFLWSNGSMVR
jgi:hypothetical protein